MHPSEAGRYKKLQQVLLLAAWDMQQAEAAARALEAETENLPLMRALETAMAVCSIRAFTPSTLGTLSSQYVPTTPPDSDLHTWFRERRDKEYAHTDKKSSRTASIEVISWTGNFVNACGTSSGTHSTENASRRPSTSSSGSATGYAATAPRFRSCSTGRRNSRAEPRLFGPQLAHSDTSLDFGSG
jgi:hypothetical protein